MSGKGSSVAQLELTNRVNVVMLEQRANHSVANHYGGNLEGVELQSGQPRALVIRSGLCEVSLVQLADFMKVGDEAKGCSVSLENVSWKRRVKNASHIRRWPKSLCCRRSTGSGSRVLRA
jgi:hypothetical protein